MSLNYFEVPIFEYNEASEGSVDNFFVGPDGLKKRKSSFSKVSPQKISQFQIFSRTLHMQFTSYFWGSIYFCHSMAALLHPSLSNFYVHNEEY